MRLQRIMQSVSLYFLLTIPCNCKLVSFFAKLLNKSFKDNIQCKKFSLTLKLSNYTSFRSSLKYHLFWGNCVREEYTMYLIINMFFNNIKGMLL